MVGERGGISGGGGGGNRAEADRWLVTSEKLLASSDLQGAKTFAIRACEADPTRAEAADYILAICDIILAGETRLGDSNLPDWYAVLRLGRLAQNPEHVATQYRRLALLLNPSVNHLPFADRAFKFVSDAWFVLSDPSKKSLYDRELQLSQLGQLGQSGFYPQTQTFQWNPSHSTNVAQEQPSASRSATSQSQAGTSSDPMATSFWTACPYCFVLFEYPKAYEECTLKCQECRRAFQAVTIQKPPVEGKGEEDVYFCSWAVFPLGYTGEFQTPSWSPISPLFACPLQKVDDEPTLKKRKEPAPPRIYYDDDDIYVAISDDDYEEANAGGDGDWQDAVQVNKKVNVGKGKETVVRSNKKHGAEKAGKGIQNVESSSGSRNPVVSIASDAVGVASSSGVMSKAVSSGTRKRMGTGAKNLGRLDLNVEFSNEGEEPGVAGGRNVGNGLGANREVDNMEGIGFFEGLDEFLNSLPILSVVGDDKIKAT
ncbi:Chaperone protein dnaJ A6 [Cardamine amara subsp. amara]|uniref:Chaperone protein dnaJ A6 n=1 Tax=Cardamine amara subsp. amara TaxID=228776 RepID=A0ABD1B8X9_CARAN